MARLLAQFTAVKPPGNRSDRLESDPDCGTTVAQGAVAAVASRAVAPPHKARFLREFMLSRRFPGGGDRRKRGSFTAARIHRYCRDLLRRPREVAVHRVLTSCFVSSDGNAVYR
jgi:hypothetical protein